MSRLLDPLNQTIDEWQSLAEEDTLGSCLPAPDDDYWDEEKFFETGHEDVEWVMDQIEDQDMDYPTYNKALDFGCGAGRLTQALANVFLDCVGVDSSERMIEFAQEYATEINDDHDEQVLTFLLNKKPDLAIFTNSYFDFVCSQLVLQHIPPPYAGIYIQEFMRVLKPNGIFAFQIPDRVRGRNISPYTDINHPADRLKTYAIPLPDVFDLVHDSGGQICRIVEDQRAGRDWVSYYYFGVKRA